jgi:hypothetical protein
MPKLRPFLKVQMSSCDMNEKMKELDEAWKEAAK